MELHHTKNGLVRPSIRVHNLEGRVKDTVDLTWKLPSRYNNPYDAIPIKIAYKQPTSMTKSAVKLPYLSTQFARSCYKEPYQEVGKTEDTRKTIEYKAHRYFENLTAMKRSPSELAVKRPHAKFQGSNFYLSDNYSWWYDQTLKHRRMYGRILLHRPND